MFADFSPNFLPTLHKTLPWLLNIAVIKWVVGVSVLAGLTLVVLFGTWVSNLHWDHISSGDGGWEFSHSPGDFAWQMDWWCLHLQFLQLLSHRSTKCPFFKHIKHLNMIIRDASNNVFPGVDICFLATRRWEMSFSAVNAFWNSLLCVWKAPKTFWLSVAGNDGPLTYSAVLLIFWLISLVPISLWIWPRSRSPKRLETYFFFTCIRISSESLARMIGISKLP